MAAKKEAAGRIEVRRYANPEAEAERWLVQQDGEAWRAVGPNGDARAIAASAAEVLQQSGACRYERGSALHIRTNGLISPFELFPALQGWLDNEDAGDTSSDWSEHAELGWVAEALEQLSAEDSFGLVPSRLIALDGGLCGVRHAQAAGGNQKGVFSHFVVMRELDPPEPEFFDRWAWISADNGWGRICYDVGELVPGVVGELCDVLDGDATVSLSPLPENHPAGLYDQVLARLLEVLSPWNGFINPELKVEGQEVTAVFPEGWEYGGEISGWLGPTVMSSRGVS